MKQGISWRWFGDCPSFERDVQTWCDRMKKTKLSVKDEGEGRLRIQIQF